MDQGIISTMVRSYTEATIMDRCSLASGIDLVLLKRKSNFRKQVWCSGESTHSHHCGPGLIVSLSLVVTPRINVLFLSPLNQHFQRPA